jgi:raffinose/stachyose/melibiose transport system permease protein
MRVNKQIIKHKLIINNKWELRKIFTYILACIVTLIMVVPLIWLILISLKTQQDIMLKPLAFPNKLIISNYIKVLKMPEFRIYYLNSIIVTTFALIINIIICSWAAYGFSKFNFKGKVLFFTLIFSAVMIPGNLLIIPLSLQMKVYGLTNNLLGLILIYVTFRLPISIFILRSFFFRIPTEISEAGYIDGASEWLLFWKIMFPIAKPAIATISVINFIFMWNEFTFALILIQDEAKRTLPMGVFKFVGENLSNYANASAFLVLSALPLIIWYIISSEWIIKGMTSGSVKG